MSDCQIFIFQLYAARNASIISVSLSCSDSTDSENEDGGFEKLKKAVGHLFTGGVSDGEVSESADSSAAEEEEVEEQEIVTEEETCSTRSLAMERAVFLKKHCKNNIRDTTLQLYVK